MLMTFDEVSKLITEGKLLHVSGTEALLKKLPEGSWIGGSTEYFMTKDGGIVTGDKLYATEFPYPDFTIKSYDESEIKTMPEDAYGNGFTIVIIPFDSAVHKEYAKNAANYEGLFMKNILGWISGLNLGAAGQTPVAVNGVKGETAADKAVALHIRLPEDKTAAVNIINIFEPNESSPVIEFTKDGFTVDKCLINGKETVLAEYISRTQTDTNLPLIGDYSGTGINISFRGAQNGVVHFYAPVFKGIEYRFAKSVGSYAEAFNKIVKSTQLENTVFACNCILNFLYGELEGKKISMSCGPITFGEIAYQLVNQTLVYLTVS